MKAKLETSSKEQAESRDETKFGVRDAVRDDPVAVRDNDGKNPCRQQYSEGGRYLCSGNSPRGTKRLTEMPWRCGELGPFLRHFLLCLNCSLHLRLR